MSQSACLAAKPCVDLAPDGGQHRSGARPRPHVILTTGRTPFALEDIVVGQGTVVVVNAPGGRATFTDAVRIARVRRALRVLGSVARARQARALIEARIEAMGHCMALDCRIEALIAQLGVAPEAFFDAVEWLEGASALEMALAGEQP